MPEPSRPKGRDGFATSQSDVDPASRVSKRICENLGKTGCVMKRNLILALAGAASLAGVAVLIFAVSAFQERADADKVLAEMTKGDVAEICQGGPKAIKKAAKSATFMLARSGEISGDFGAVGNAAGRRFYRTKC